MSASSLEIPSGSRYTDEIRTQAAIQYAIKGNIAAIERELSIPRRTLNEWSRKDWFIELVAELRQENQNEHIAQYHEITRKALDKASKAIDGLGDDLSASDIKALVVTGATATDKGRLLLNLPTSIRGDTDSIAKLQAQFEKLSANHRAIEQTVVDEQ